MCETTTPSDRGEREAIATPAAASSSKGVTGSGGHVAGSHAVAAAAMYATMWTVASHLGDDVREAGAGIQRGARQWNGIITRRSTQLSLQLDTADTTAYSEQAHPHKKSWTQAFVSTVDEHVNWEIKPL